MVMRHSVVLLQREVNRQNERFEQNRPGTERIDHGERRTWGLSRSTSGQIEWIVGESAPRLGITPCTWWRVLRPGHYGLMEQVVLGVDDETTARAAVMWIMERAQRGDLRLRLVAELDDGGSNPGCGRSRRSRDAVRSIEDAAAGIEVDFVLADRPLLHELLEHE